MHNFIDARLGSPVPDKRRNLLEHYSVELTLWQLVHVVRFQERTRLVGNLVFFICGIAPCGKVNVLATDKLY